MENTNYGISPDEEMSSIMKDIEKNIQEQQGEESLEQDDSEVELATNEEDGAIQDDEIKVSEEEEPIIEDDTFREKYYIEKKKRKSALADRQRLEQENYQLKNALGKIISHLAKIDNNTFIFDNYILDNGLNIIHIYHF